MKIKRLRRQETPRIVGDDSARSEPTEVADSNNFKPLLKEKRLKEQTKVLRISKETEIKNNTQGEKQRDSVVYREKKGRKNTLAKEYGEDFEGLQDYKNFDSTLIRKIKRHQGLLATIVHDQNQREVADSNRLQSTLEEEEEHESIKGTNTRKRGTRVVAVNATRKRRYTSSCETKTSGLKLCETGATGTRHKGKKETLGVYKETWKTRVESAKEDSCVFAINATLEQERIHIERCCGEESVYVEQRRKGVLKEKIWCGNSVGTTQEQQQGEKQRVVWYTEKRKEGRIRWPRNTVKTLLGLHNAAQRKKRKRLTNGEEEAIRDCYRRFIDMIKVYHETARCPGMRSQEEKWEKRPTRQAG
ncbi:hypothetical protein Tco_1277373 [Tanacetum coccineum]